MAASGEDSSKLLYWIMSGLLTVTLMGVGLYARALDGRLQEVESRITQVAAREEQRYETSGARWERLSVLESKQAGLEPRLGDVASRCAALEARVPLVESKLTSADARLARIEQKLDDALARRAGGGR